MLAAAVLVAGRRRVAVLPETGLGRAASAAELVVAERERKAMLPETGLGAVVPGAAVPAAVPVGAVAVGTVLAGTALAGTALAGTGRREAMRAVAALAVTVPVVTVPVVRLAAAAELHGRVPAETERRAATGRADRPPALPAHVPVDRALLDPGLPARQVPAGVRAVRVPSEVARQTAALVEVGARGSAARAGTAGLAIAARVLRPLLGAGQTAAQALIAASTVRAG